METPMSKKKTYKPYIIGTVIVALIVFSIATVAIMIHNHLLGQRVILSDTLAMRIELRIMDIFPGEHPELDFVVYNQNDLRVSYNYRNVRVYQKENEEWVLTHLLNPSPLRHFRMQGSTISRVVVDSSENYIAIYSASSLDDINDPIFIFDLSRSRFTQYEHGDFPDDIDFG